MKKILHVLIFLMSISYINAQTPVGLKHDVNGIPFNGYYDPMSYTPVKKISRVHSLESFEKGYYYNRKGGKIEGLLKFKSNNNAFFKEKKDDLRRKLRIKQVRHFVIGVDSFFAINKFFYKKKLKDKPVFLQYITEINDYVFAKYYHSAPPIGSTVEFIETFLVKEPNSVIWTAFPKNKKIFEERALKYFGHIPFIADKINSGEYSSADMLSIIKMAEYFEKHKNSKPVFYDQYWQEVKDADKATYSAMIVEKVDSIWTFDYYKGKTKIYQAQYSSFFPHIKNGEYKAFYPDGTTRQSIIYSENKPQEVSNFSAEGLIQTHYRIHVEENQHQPWKTRVDINYTVAYDPKGQNILKSDHTLGFPIHDTFSGFDYTYNYKKGELLSVYRVQDKDTIFQITDPNYKIKLDPLQRRFDYFITMTENDFTNAIQENAQGTVLVNLLIDDKGYVLEGTLLNSVHPDIDQLVKDFISKKLLKGAEFRYKFKPYKKDRKKRHCEVVIPFEFNIDRFYRKPVSYYYYYNPFMDPLMNPALNHFPQITPPAGF